MPSTVPRATPAFPGPGSDSRSREDSSRHTADGSGRSDERVVAHRSGSRCQWRGWTESAMASERVLIVDDEPQIRRALQTALAGHGYDVAVASNVDSAMTLIGAPPPDAIVLDLVMPGMDGFAVLREIRSWSEVPVIVLSARGQEQDKVSARDLGADDYLTKPFGMAELLARVRVVLRRGATTHDTVIAFGEVM